MRQLLSLFVLVVALGPVPAECDAQVRIAGVVWDSLRAVPLADAFVTVATRSGTSDAAGHFVLDSVPAGSRVLTIQHAVFDSIGMPGVTMRIVVKEGMDTIRTGVPSFRRLWSVACAGTAVTPGRGFVFGTVHDADTAKPTEGSKVTARWTDISLANNASLSQRGFRADATTDSTGTYILCNVPIDHTLSMSASTTGSASGEISVIVDSTLAIRRQDLAIGAHGVGVVAGSVVNERGQGVAEARVVIGAMPEVRTRADGSFRVFAVPTGSQQIEALAIGSPPVSGVVNVTANDTARVELALRRVQQLDSMKVVATSARQIMANQLEERHKLGIGHFRDSTDLARTPSLPTVLETFPAVKVKEDGTRSTIAFPSTTGMGLSVCTPTIWIDRHNQQVTTPSEAFRAIKELEPKDIAMMEVYVRPTEVPPEYLSKRPNAPLCGAILVWTKAGLP